MPEDVSTVTGVVINPDSNNPTSFDQTSTLTTEDNGGIGEDGFTIGANLTGSNVTEQINIAIAIDQSGSTANDSGTDFNGDGTNETVLEAQLFGAAELFQAYVDAGYDPSEVTISLVTYTNDAEARGTYTLDQASDFVTALEDIRDEGPLFTTNYVAGLNAVGDAWTAGGIDPADTNVLVFMSDGYPVPGGQDISGAAQNLEDDWGALITGVGLGANSSLDALNELDNTGGATQVLSGDELLDIVVEPLTDADFLRFEITIEGLDENDDPMTQTITIPEGDPRITTTQLGWSFTGVDIDPEFAAPQDVTVTVNSVFGPDPEGTSGDDQFVTTVHDVPLVICFTPGTLILTPNGQVKVEDLAAGDRVITRDHGVQTVRWVGHTDVSVVRTQINPNLRPVLIRKDALGPGQPEQDMRVSRQHRILVRDWRAEMLFGAEGGVLAPAFTLCNDSTIREEYPSEPVTYIHIAFDQHEIIYADGIEAESLHPAEAMVSGMTEEARAELLELFPELADQGAYAFDTARAALRGRDAAVLRAPVRET